MKHIATIDWLIPLFIGIYFTSLAAIKLIGRKRGIIGGGGKPFSIRLYGSCPTWSKGVNKIIPYAILTIGLSSLSYGLWVLWHIFPHQK